MPLCPGARLGRGGVAGPAGAGLLRLVLFAVAIALPPSLRASQDAAPRPASTVQLFVASSRPDLVTGGEALVRIVVPPGARRQNLRVTLNAVDVTAVFRPGAAENMLVGLITGLAAGRNTLAASVGSSTPSTLTLTAYPSAGPVISGPHERPYVCETDRFPLQGGGTLGPPLDEHCSAKSRTDYVYRSTADATLEPLAASSTYPPDLAQVDVLGATRPYVVRIETGTVNRAIYQIAMLHDPREPAPDFATRSRGWNGRLIYTFGGGCPGGWYRQGRTTGGVTDDAMLRAGYAVASATLNVFGNNCNDLLAAETMMMVKERFIERYGEPLFTIGMGCSGGSYQVHQIADNYPGLLDGIIAGCSFPDVAHAAISVHSFGARLLHRYFQSTSEPWTRAQQVAASGLPDYTSLQIQGTRPDRLRPRDVCDPAIPAPLLYDPVSNPRGARCTVYDHTVNVYGRDPATGFARRPLDNVGVQYGLKALNDGHITTAQFLDLNEQVGGLDADANFVPQRTVADLAALRAAYDSGRILNGGGGLADTPIIDYRGYSDFAKGDPHLRFHSFSTRERLIRANGHADNHIMLVEDGATYGLFSTRSPVLSGALDAMDRWLTTLRGDLTSDPRRVTVVRARPPDLVDACFDRTGRKIVERQRYGAGRCHDLFPSHASPYLVAGMPLANDVLKCRRQPVERRDYAVAFSPAEFERLRRIFPNGVCDYSKPGIEQRPLEGTWLSFGPALMR